MPQKGQRSVTLSDINIPSKLDFISEHYDYSFSGLVTYCIWVQFGTDSQKKKAKNILRLFK